MLQIDKRLLEPNSEADITENFNRILGEKAGAKIQLDFNATLSEDLITAELDNTIKNFKIERGTEYLIHIYLPLETLTGDLDDEYKLVLKDKDGNNININCIFQEDIDDTATVGDLCQIQEYDIGIGYSWTFTGYYKELNDNGTMKRVITTDVIVRETVSAMKGSKLHNKLVNSKLKTGNVIICTEDYENNGSTYTKGKMYLISGELVEGELILSAEEL